MAWWNKVVWSEGMFLRPHHFQQQTRYIENYVEARVSPTRCYPWGVKELTIDQQLLSLGKFNLISASGVFPDGTPFNIPESDDPPEPLELDVNVRDQIIYLSLPVRHPGTVEVTMDGSEEGLARNNVHEYQVRDSNSGIDDISHVQIGKLRMRYLLESEEKGQYARLGIARVNEVGADKQISLDTHFIPSTLNCASDTVLTGFIKELNGLLHQRGEALAGRVTASGQGGAAEITDFLLLQIVNRYEPIIAHYSSLAGLHPIQFFEKALELAGEISTITNVSKRPIEFGPYMHESLSESFLPVMQSLRESFSMEVQSRALPIALQDKGYGIKVAIIPDKTMLEDSSFVLVVSADISIEEIRALLPPHIKIGPVEQIRDLVTRALPGIKLVAMPVAPRQMPYHAGSVYFELDRSSDLWEGLKTSGGMAMHLGRDFPGIELELWVVRR